MTSNIIIFCATYAGIAIGGIPGLALDRTGIALLGAIAMLLTSALTPVQALGSIDFSTILLLYGLMIVSAQFRISGFYSYLAQRIGASTASPERFLLIIMGSAAMLSALLTNDIVCLAFTPVIIPALFHRKLNPVPYCIGLAVAANIGSAATIIGNPQNMLIGQTGHLSFAHFSAWCLPPVVISFFASFFIIRRMFTLTVSDGDNKNNTHPSYTLDRRQSFSRRQSIKGLLVLIAVIIMFFTPVHREASVMIAAAVLLLSRTTKSIELLERVDWNLITLFCGLFIVMEGISVTGLPAQIIQELSRHGITLSNGYALTGLSVALSNIVSNVPAVILMTPHLSPGNPYEWYLLALTSTFAGNLIIIGSIANLITFQIAASFGIKISFREHVRAGLPVTFVSIIIALLWNVFAA